MWTDLGHEVLDSEVTSNRFQGEVHAGREETNEVKSNIRFLGRCPTVLGLVARFFVTRLVLCKQARTLWQDV